METELVLRGFDLRASEVEEALRAYYGDRRSIRIDSSCDSDRSRGTISSVGSGTGATDSESVSTKSGGGVADDIYIFLPAAAAGASSPPGTSSGVKMAAENEELQNLLETVSRRLDEKEVECAELSETKTKALATVQTFHMQQKQLFDEFQLLRQRYDEQRDVLQEILWLHCGPHHPDLKAIPAVKDAQFVETVDRVGDFSIGDVLGEGQFATVYNCRRTDPVSGEASGPDLALKIIKKEKITTFNSLRHVGNEIELLRQLSCDFIVRIEDIVQTGSRLYIITEKGGKDMFEFFDEHPDGVSEEWAREIMVCVLRGVKYMHEQGICHRDLKPENILVTFDSARGRCVDLKLCDFGLATRFEPNTFLSDFCGSPGFFAPEMVIRGTYYGDKADVWSCGCILLELTLGHERFCDTWMCAYDYEVLQDKAVFAKEIRLCIERLMDSLSFSEELNEFICKFLRLRSSLRPSIQDVCGDVWLGGAIDVGPGSSSSSGDAGRLSSRSVESFSEKSSASTSSGSGPGSGGANPNRHSVYGIEEAVDNTEVDPDILQKSFSSMSERERHMYEEHNKTRADSSKPGEHLLHLPPIEPPTPNMHAARKILKKGEVLVQHAVRSEMTSGARGWNSGGVAGGPLSISTPDGPSSPDAFSSPITPGQWRVGSPGRPSLPLLSEAAQEKDDDDLLLQQQQQQVRKPSLGTGDGGARRLSRDRDMAGTGSSERRNSKTIAAANAAAAAAALAEQIEEDSRQAAASLEKQPVVFSPRSPRLNGGAEAKGGGWS